MWQSLKLRTIFFIENPALSEEMASGRAAPSDRHVERSETSMFLSEI